MFISKKLKVFVYLTHLQCSEISIIRLIFHLCYFICKFAKKKLKNSPSFLKKCKTIMSCVCPFSNDQSVPLNMICGGNRGNVVIVALIMHWCSGRAKGYRWISDLNISKEQWLASNIRGGEFQCVGRTIFIKSKMHLFPYGLIIWTQNFFFFLPSYIPFIDIFKSFFFYSIVNCTS